MIRMNFRTVFILILLLCNVSIYCQKPDRLSDRAKKIVITDTTYSILIDTIFSNLYALNDTIYRCEQPNSLGFIKLNNIGIKSVLNLCLPNKDKNLIYRLPLNLYNVKMVASNIRDKKIIKALKILKTAPKPIVIHCNHGSDRTGVVIAMYRIIFQNWTKEKALNEMKNGEYGFHKIYSNISHYINKLDIERIKKEISDCN
jgi:tyrosine-protein phosphatase SIW14